MTLWAGLALKVISSPVKGLTLRGRALVACLCFTTHFTKHFTKPRRVNLQAPPLLGRCGKMYA